MTQQFITLVAILVACGVAALPSLAAAQTAPAIPPLLATPDRVETRIGTLEFKDGAPTVRDRREGARHAGLHAPP